MRLTGTPSSSPAVPAVSAAPLPRFSINAAIRSSSPAAVRLSSTRSPPPTPACAASNSTLKILVPSMPFPARVPEQFPELNVLINNAGISKPEVLTADTIDLSVARSIIQTNIVSVLHLNCGTAPDPQTAAEFNYRHHHFRLGLRSPRRFPYLLRKQGFSSLLAAVGSGFSSGKRLWRSSNLSRHTCRRNLLGPVR